MTDQYRPWETAVRAPAAVAPSATTTTTLYDLIATMQDVGGPDNDGLVVATVRDMLSVGSPHRAKRSRPAQDGPEQCGRRLTACHLPVAGMFSKDEEERDGNEHART